MKNTLYILLLAFSSTAALAQPPTFSKNIDIDKWENTAWGLSQDGEGLFIYGPVICDGQRCASLIKTTFEGELIWRYDFEGLKVPSLNCMITTDSCLYLLLRETELPSRRIRIFQMSLDGQLQREWALGEQMQYEIPFGFTPFGDGFVIYGEDTPPGQSNNINFLLFCDANFQLVETRFYEEFGEYGLVAEHDLFATSTGSLIGTAGRGYLGSISTAVSRIDSLGEVAWQMVFPPVILNDSDLIKGVELDNGNLAVCWFYYWSAAYPFTKVNPVVYGLSPQGDSLWEYRFNTVRPTANIHMELAKARNGDILGMGYSWMVLEEGLPPGLVGWIFRMAPNGFIIWDRYIYDARFPGRNADLLKVVELPDGSLVFAGSIEDTLTYNGQLVNHNDIWLVRVDSNGCLTPGCGNLQIVTDTGVVQLTPVREEPRPTPPQPFRLGPNPLREQLFLHLAPGSGPPLREVELRLSNALGQPAWRHRWASLAPGQQVSALLPELPPGWYAWSLTVEGQWRQSGGVLKVR